MIERLAAAPLRLLPDLSPVGWFLLVAMMILIVSYLYFWYAVIKAMVHKHVLRESVSQEKLSAALDHAARNGDTRHFIIQITTKGGALSVVRRGIDNVLESVSRYPVLRDVLRVEVVTEEPTEVDALRMEYDGAEVSVVPHLLPPEYATAKGTRLKARALHYMVEQHRAHPTDSYVVHYDEESVYTPDNLARLVQRLCLYPVGISEGMISYGLDWNDATLLNKAMESNRPFGCHECYSVMTSPPPLHLHGSNLVIRQDLENAVGWDIGTLGGSALIAEDLVFGLAAYVAFGREVFGWHHTEMIEQPPFTIKAAYKQRERWVFGALQAVTHIAQQPQWSQLPVIDRWRTQVLIRLRVITYALGFPVSLIALGSNAVVLAVLGVEATRTGMMGVHAPELTVYGMVTALGLVLWLAGTQLGLYYNLRYAGMSTAQKVRDHLLVLVVTPLAGIVDTAGPVVALAKWVAGVREVAWKPTPKLARPAVPHPSLGTVAGLVGETAS